MKSTEKFEPMRMAVFVFVRGGLARPAGKILIDVADSGCVFARAVCYCVELDSMS